MASLATKKKKKKCPPGYRRNPKTGRCNKKKEPKLDSSHTKLRNYIKNNETSKIKKWLEKEGIDWKKICDDDATDTEDESSDDEKKKKSPVKKGDCLLVMMMMIVILLMMIIRTKREENSVIYRRRRQ